MSQHTRARLKVGLGAALVIGLLQQPSIAGLLPSGETSNDSGQAPSTADGCANLSSDQTRMTRVIWRVSDDLGIPDRGRVIAYATAIQESNLHNLGHGDRDSLGLFQQRPSQGWGTPSQVTDPEHATRSFYQALRGVDGWRTLPVTEAAQSVQRSAYPDAYADHADEARAIVDANGCT